jgi:rubrerythrin
VNKGFMTVRKLLAEDIEFERTAVKTYRGFAKRIEDSEIKQMFQSLAEDENGHTNGLTETLNKLETGEFELEFYCPRCGWNLSFGKGFHANDEVKCPMCENIFRLVEKNGDYILRVRVKS